jgi:hypothetical protein
MLRPTRIAAVIAMLLIFGATLLPAQGPPAPTNQQGQGQAQGNRGRRPFDPARWEEMRLTRTQEQLKVTDTEWSAIKPLVSAVLKAQQNVMAGGMRGMFGGGRGRGNRGGGNNPGAANNPAGGNNPGGPLATLGNSPEREALSTALDNEGTSNAELKAKLKAYRAKVKKDQNNLKTARENLRKVLSIRQEATLVLSGILD